MAKFKVSEVLAELKQKEANKRYNSGDFRNLIHAIVTDGSHKAKKTFYKGAERIIEEESVKDDIDAFMDKLLKHAGVKDEAERKAIIENFDIKTKDIQFIEKIYKEAAYQYVVESGKTLEVFNDKPLTLTIKKKERTGKYAGMLTLSRVSKDKEYALKHPKAKKAAK